MLRFIRRGVRNVADAVTATTPTTNRPAPAGAAKALLRAAAVAAPLLAPLAPASTLATAITEPGGLAGYEVAWPSAPEATGPEATGEGTEPALARQYPVPAPLAGMTLFDAPFNADTDAYANAYARDGNGAPFTDIAVAPGGARWSRTRWNSTGLRGGFGSIQPPREQGAAPLAPARTASGTLGQSVRIDLGTENTAPGRADPRNTRTRSLDDFLSLATGLRSLARAGATQVGISLPDLHDFIAYTADSTMNSRLGNSRLGDSGPGIALMEFGYARAGGGTALGQRIEIGGADLAPLLRPEIPARPRTSTEMVIELLWRLYDFLTGGLQLAIIAGFLAGWLGWRIARRIAYRRATGFRKM